MCLTDRHDNSEATSKKMKLKDNRLIKAASRIFGLRREERLLYLGPAGVPLSPRSTRVVCEKRMYEVQAAHPVGAGPLCHWWAVLRPLDKEGP